MDRNNEGLLTVEERKEMASLVEWSENVSLLRAQALQLLGPDGVDSCQLDLQHLPV
ncbi:MAG: hypothetical protein LW645_12810 [Verrucomicrobiaceae bacterium]|jgi:hypothetical protein|nr:hypothetical protein [Verrucomicrobiaceae bacterium]